MRSNLYHILNKENHTRRQLYFFLNALIQTNCLIIYWFDYTLIDKGLTRSFIKFNTLMENESKRFTNISIFSLKSWSQILAFIFVFWQSI